MAPTDTPPLEIQYAKRDGEPIGFASLGSGSPVLWLTPFAVPLAAQWHMALNRDFVSNLAQTHRVLLVDDPHYRPGFSEEERPVPETFLDDFVGDLNTVLDHADVDHCHVVANLLTTIPAIVFAARFPQRVTSLLLWNGMLTGEEGLADPSARQQLSFIARTPSTTVATQAYIGTLGISGSAEELQEQREIVSAIRRVLPGRIALRGLSTSKAVDEAATIQCPTLVVAPEAAVIPGRAVVERVAQAIPRASLIAVPSPAVGMELADRDIAVPLLRNWLDQAERGGRVSASNADTRNLTAREIEVLTLVEQGLTNPQIADRLSITRNTTGKHVSNLMRKLEARNRTEAARIARERGLLH